MAFAFEKLLVYQKSIDFADEAWDELAPPVPRSSLRESRMAYSSAALIALGLLINANDECLR